LGGDQDHNHHEAYEASRKQQFLDQVSIFAGGSGRVGTTGLHRGEEQENTENHDE
jgi:hypothetical protein